MYENAVLKSRAPGELVHLISQIAKICLIRIFIGVQQRITLPCKHPYCLQRPLKVRPCMVYRTWLPKYLQMGPMTYL